MPSPQKLFIYARKSTDDRDKQVQSIPDQISELRAFAHEQGIHVIEVLTEKQSAKSPGRKVFEGNACPYLSGRGRRAFLPGTRTDLPVTWQTEQNWLSWWKQWEPILSFPPTGLIPHRHGIFCLSLAFGQSKLFVDNLRENVTRGMRNKAKRGIYPAKPPIGYLNNRNTKMIDPDPKYVSLVVSLFKKYSTGKDSNDDIHTSFSILEV